MKKFSIYVLTLLVIASVTGCSSHRYTIIEPATVSLTEYSILEIPQFTTPLKDDESQELARRFADRLYRAIQEHSAKNPEEVIYDEVTLATNQTEGVLLLKGTIISYEEGSRAKRYFIGFGSGKAYCTIQTVFIDKATGEELARTNFDGELAMGLFGGNVDEAVDGVVNAFIDYMKEYMSS